MIDVEKALADFDANKSVYERMGNSTVLLIQHILNDSGIKPASVTFRIKERQSLREKLTRVGKVYAELNEVKDIVGVRVITFFEDQLDNIDSLIKEEFLVDPKHSYDRLSQLSTDQFRYRSIHYVCSHRPERLALTENRAFADKAVEIQTRSILQHAWAEIEHEYYKDQGNKPATILRRNSRLAGTLEIADAEFVAIRKDMERYKKSIDLRIGVRDSDLSAVSIDSVSLLSYIMQEQQVLELDEQVAKGSERKLADDANDQAVNAIVRAVRAAGIFTLAELRATFSTYAASLPEYVFEVTRLRVKSDLLDRTGVLSRGTSVFYIAALSAGKKGEAVVNSVHAAMRGSAEPEDTLDELAKLHFAASQNINC